MPGSLSHAQKMSIVLAIVVGVGGVTFSVKALKFNLLKPSQTELAKSQALFGNDPYLTPEEKQAAEEEAMKTKDTDGEGLSDYDEVFVYRTSPYIADSDSDGFDDKTEVFSSNDPNCPSGKICGSVIANAEAVAPATDVKLPENTNPFIGSDPASSLAATSGLQGATDINSVLSSITPAQVREVLTQAGVPKDALDAATDQELMDLVRQAMEESQKNPEFAQAIGQETDSTQSSQ